MNQFVVAAFLICTQHVSGHGYGKGFEACATVTAEYNAEKRADDAAKLAKDRQIVMTGYGSIPNWRRYELEKGKAR